MAEFSVKSKHFAFMKKITKFYKFLMGITAVFHNLNESNREKFADGNQELYQCEPQTYLSNFVFFYKIPILVFDFSIFFLFCILRKKHRNTNLKTNIYNVIVFIQIYNDCEVVWATRTTYYLWDTSTSVKKNRLVKLIE